MTTLAALVAFAVLFAIYGLLARRASCGPCGDEASRCAACPHENESDSIREVER